MLLGAFGVCAFLLFYRLGAYALWDDEAGTALTARSVLRHADISALVDEHNVFAYRAGFGIEDLKLRYVLPLPVLLTAAGFVSAGDQTALAARIPFACLGLGTVGFVLWWARRRQASPLLLALLALGLVLNVSFLLHSRQCRYFAPATFFSTIIVFIYLTPRWTIRRLVIAGVLSALLFASSYLCFAALWAVLALDYLIWRRKESRVSLRQAAALFVPQILLGAVVAAIWNPLVWKPLGIGADGASLRNSPAQWCQLFLWQWRELNQCEFACGALVAAGLLIGLRRGDRWLVRGTVALTIYLGAVTALSPQPVAITTFADVRYLMPVIPLGVFLAARTLVELTGTRALPALGLGIIAFGSNALHGGPLLWSGLRSTFVEYLRELHRPPPDPYAVTADWINRNVGKGESVWAVPDHTPYPLMFHAPKAVYAWQLAAPPAGQFAGLPMIHFRGLEAPNYVVVFGPAIEPAGKILAEMRSVGVPYRLVAVLDHYWRELHRPELIWHRFTPMTEFDRNREAIYIFRRDVARRDTD